MEEEEKKCSRQQRKQDKLRKKFEKAKRKQAHKSAKKEMRKYFSSNINLRIIMGLVGILAYFILKNILVDWNDSLKDIIEAIILSFITVIFADLLVNCRYVNTLEEALYGILTNRKLMKTFVASDKKDQIMNISLETVLGNKVADAINSIILNNYLKESYYLMREDYYCHVYMSKCSEDSRFYNLHVSINFRIPQSEYDLKLTVGGYNSIEEIEKEEKHMSPQHRFLFFPFLLADGLNTLSVTPNFQVKIENADKAGAKIVSSKESGKLVWRADIKKDILPCRIQITIDTFLNNKENIFYDDIRCLHDGYHISFEYEPEMIGECKCYHSCKSKELVSENYNNNVKIDINGIVLPENNFVFFWEKRE